MKLIPRNYDLFADVFDDMFNSSLTRGVSSIMKTDIHEKDGNYVVDVELPGYKKEDISIDLKNGYLSISAKHETNETEKNEKGYVIHEERSFGSCSRSYYVGEYVKPEDIKAKFDNGILTLVIPNTDKKQVEASKPIMIE
ncbi:MAG: Hsp20/alpha crystallin family protein [Erysipelotrichaceae bacterium]|nr:Hsp20/alpha crystallin family protein [Erysipelotrichaceae bacterium]